MGWSCYIPVFSDKKVDICHGTKMSSRTHRRIIVLPHECQHIYKPHKPATPKHTPHPHAVLHSTHHITRTHAPYTSHTIHNTCSPTHHTYTRITQTHTPTTTTHRHSVVLQRPVTLLRSRSCSFYIVDLQKLIFE